MSYKVTEVFADTNEIIEREMTAAEMIQHEKDLLDLKKKSDEKNAQEAAKISALAKLAALGLTPEEISAIS